VIVSSNYKSFALAVSIYL